jgi:hypothetical protein
MRKEIFELGSPMLEEGIDERITTRLSMRRIPEGYGEGAFLITRLENKK